MTQHLQHLNYQQLAGATIQTPLFEAVRHGSLAAWVMKHFAEAMGAPLFRSVDNNTWSCVARDGQGWVVRLGTADYNPVDDVYGSPEQPPYICAVQWATTERHPLLIPELLVHLYMDREMMLHSLLRSTSITLRFDVSRAIELGYNDWRNNGGGYPPNPLAPGRA